MTVDNKSCSHFPLPLRGEFHDNGERIILLSPFVYEDKDKQIIVKVPEGFESDFNSVPRPLWGYFPPWQYPEAGVIHDWLYRHPEGFMNLQKTGQQTPLSREDCDDIHRRILDILGCRWSKRQVAYLGLRAGGWRPWNRYRGMDSQKVSNSSSTIKGEFGKSGDEK